MFWELTGDEKKSLFIVDSADNKLYRYPEIKSAVGELASVLKLPRKGIAALFCDNGYSSIAAYLAALNSGNAALLINNSTDKTLAANILDTYKPEIIITQGENGVVPDGYHSIERPIDGLNIYRQAGEPGPEIFADTALLLSTSGTTGNPKLVRLSYSNLQSNSASIAEYLGIDENERPITSLPMSYSYGLSVINSHILKGSGIVCSNDTIMQKAFWNTFRENECTSFAGVPYSYEMLLRLRFGSMSLPSLKTMTQAGGKLSKENIIKFYEIAKSKGFRFIVMYGATEATARIAWVPWDKQPEKAGSAGKAIPGGTIEILSGDGAALPPDSQGEVAYKGPNVMLGYAECRQDLSKGNESGGILMTGDIGYLDRDGFLYITGRLKRFAKITGQRVNLDDIEKLIKEKLGIDSAALPNDDIISVLAESGSDGAADAARNLISSTYSLHNSLVEVKTIDKVLYTSSGKKDYGTMKELYSK